MENREGAKHGYLLSSEARVTWVVTVPVLELGQCYNGIDLNTVDHEEKATLGFK